MAIKEVEIGILDRNSKLVHLTTVDKGYELYYSIGWREHFDNEGEFVIPVYAFESNVELFTLPDGKSDATIDREFLKRYKILKPGAINRLRKEGAFVTDNGNTFLINF